MAASSSPATEMSTPSQGRSSSTHSSPEDNNDGRRNSKSSHTMVETIKPNSGPAHPTHYLCRGGGKFTPMIALDELPSHLKIVGQPLSLSFKEIVDAGGVPCMPAVEKASENYLVVLGSGSDIPQPQMFFTPDNMSIRSEGNHAVDIPCSGTINARLARAIDGVGAYTDQDKLKTEILKLKAKNIPNNNQRYNPTTPGVLGQKVYCTHWMRTGECDFTQQGCMFLHAMPDLDTLELLGFRSYPRWFREMPRDYQLENAKDFNEVGLDLHRHSQKPQYLSDPRNSQWYNQQNRYMTPRGPPPTGYPFGAPIPIQPGMWSPNGFNPSHLPTPPGPPGQSPGPSHGSDNYNPLFSPHGFANGRPYLPPSTPPGINPSIWSRATSPAMDAINRLHKPLTPEVAAHYQEPSTPAFSGPPSLGSAMSPTLSTAQPTFTRAGGLRQQQQKNKQGSISNSKVVNGSSQETQSRGRQQQQRQVLKTPTKAADKNPFAALSTEESSSTSSSEEGKK